MKNFRLQNSDAHESLVDACLDKIQKELAPDKAKLVVAINLVTGEYALGADSREALAEFRKRWPDRGYYMCRVDGSPSGRM